MTTLTSDQLAELERLEAAATAGEWRSDYLDHNSQRVVKAEHIEICTCWHHCVESIEKEMEANASFISALRNAAKPLIEEVKQLRETNKNHRETLRGIRDMAPDVERTKQWARDGLSGYTDTVEGTILKLQDEIIDLRRQLAESKAENERLTRELDAAFDHPGMC